MPSLLRLPFNQSKVRRKTTYRNLPGKLTGETDILLNDLVLCWTRMGLLELPFCFVLHQVLVMSLLQLRKLAGTLRDSDKKYIFWSCKTI